MTSDRESAQPAPPNEPETNDAVIDSTLLRRMADGSTAAFETLRNRHRERLYWLCLREMRGNREDAEDGLCAAFDNAARNLGNYVERDPNVAALLTTFAKNACRNLLRARSRDTSLAREVTEQIARGAPQADLNCATCTDEERAELRRCIEELNPTLREPMTMKVYGAMDVREIATKLGITAHTVSQRIHRAKCELAKRLTDANTPQIIAAQMAEARLIALTLPSGRSVARRVQLGAHIPLRPAHVETLRRYVAQHPRGWVKRMELANQLLVAGDLGSALMEFTKVAADRPHELEVWLRIGEILRVQERWADARRGYEAALEHATAGAGQHHIHGWIALCCGSVEGALAAFRRAARLDPGNAAHWHAIGFTASDAQRSDEGAAAFDRALALNPDDVIALTGSHDALQHLGRDAEIVPRLERALSLAPNDVMTLKLLAVHRTSMSLVFGAEGERTRAMIRRATRLAPDTSEAWEPLQHFYDARGDRESAEAVWRNFLARRPGDARAWRLLAGQLMGSESKASAVTAIRRAAELAPDDPLAQRALCEMLARTGETAEARAAVERLLKT
ncbi:MAG: sigma-70 family RNA polymerase sigma factor, partial [Armatimonadetes bacterium]|nr:sigma-70 family RNA polymerase sigma factor [Armatimonadota bacterium]